MLASICAASHPVKNYARASNINALHHVSMLEDMLPQETIEVVTWVNNIMASLNIKPAELARQAELNQSMVSRLIRGQTPNPTIKTLRAIADISPIAIPVSVQKKLDLPGLNRREQDVNAISRQFENRIMLWGVHPLRGGAEFRFNPQGHLDSIRNPFGPNGPNKIAAFLAPDETMAPRWHAGEIVLFDLARPATNGEYAVISLTPENDPNAKETNLFRRLEKRSDGHLHVSDAAGTITRIPLHRVLDVRHAITWRDLLA